MGTHRTTFGARGAGARRSLIARVHEAFAALPGTVALTSLDITGAGARAADGAPS
ncbi:hypothetical protein [Rhodococcus zopfii]|uniref:hypothetical protein n=1 Tax=Rhodococcus zopfii TaxID=43772 RepID=UPI00147332ED|nr:hypothetical protein [Rhodococcus zopfii]